MSSFKKNIFQTISTDITILFVAMFNSVITARYLGPEGKGYLVFILVVLNLTVMFGNLGIGEASIFLIGKKKYNTQTVFNTCILWTAISATFISLFIFVISSFNPILREHLFFIIPILYIQLFSRYLTAILLGEQNLKLFNSARFIKYLFLATMHLVLIVLLGLRVEGAVMAFLLTEIFINIYILFRMKEIDIHIKPQFERKYFGDAIRYGIKIYFSNLTIFLNNKADRFLIAFYLTPYELGIYSVAANLAERILLLPDAVSKVLFPKVSSQLHSEAHKTIIVVTRFIFGLSLILGLFLIYIGHPVIIFLFGKFFSDSYIPFVVLMIGTIPFSVYRILLAYFKGLGRQNLVLYTSILSSIINIILNIILLPRYGILGASIASCFSYTSAAIVSIVMACKISNHPFYAFFQFWDLNFFEYIKTFKLQHSIKRM